MNTRPEWPATLAQLTLTNGGASIYVGHSEHPSDKAVFPVDAAKSFRNGRYFVAICEECAGFSVLNEYAKPESIEGAIRRWWTALTHDHPGTFVGTWLNGGCLYLDIVLPISNFGDALTLARANNQKAIYDAVEGEVINV